MNLQSLSLLFKITVCLVEAGPLMAPKKMKNFPKRAYLGVLWDESSSL